MPTNITVNQALAMDADGIRGVASFLDVSQRGLPRGGLGPLHDHVVRTLPEARAALDLLEVDFRAGAKRPRELTVKALTSLCPLANRLRLGACSSTTTSAAAPGSTR